jgi:glycosyltransferase involved in cell wall biosynthesis
MNTTKKKALISTIYPNHGGGVPTMCKEVAEYLLELNIEPIFAWYEPYTINKNLSSTFFDILRFKKPLIQKTTLFGYQAYKVGCWLPELEFTHYLPTKLWKNLLNKTDIHICVGGNVLSALHYSILEIPFLTWVATPFQEDRTDRLKKLKIERRIVSFFTGFVLRYLEKKILSSDKGKFLSLSKYTQKKLSLIQKKNLKDVLHPSINKKIFFPNKQKIINWNVGFSGRFKDPRKNIDLLLHAISSLKKKGYPIQLTLIGSKKDKKFLDKLKYLDIYDKTTLYEWLSTSELASVIKTLDVYVIPSKQEGICIAGLEAMASGCPIISTKCGGPEDFVLNNINGELIDFDNYKLEKAIINICNSREIRNQYSENGLDTIERYFSKEVNKDIFKKNLNQLIKNI